MKDDGCMCSKSMIKHVLRTEIETGVKNVSISKVYMFPQSHTNDEVMGILVLG